MNPIATLSRTLDHRRTTRETRAAVASFTRTARATLPAFDTVEEKALVTLGGALLFAAATGPDLSRLSNVLAKGSEFVDTADLAGLLAIAHEHLRPLMFHAE